MYLQSNTKIFFYATFLVSEVIWRVCQQTASPGQTFQILDSLRNFKF